MCENPTCLLDIANRRAANSSGLPLAELPNTTGTILVQASLTAAQSIVVIAALAYLGIGIRPPKASWGAMIKDGSQGITTGQWWIAIFPGLSVFVCVLLFNQIADRLERVLSRGARG